MLSTRPDRTDVISSSTKSLLKIMSMPKNVHDPIRILLDGASRSNKKKKNPHDQYSEIVYRAKYDTNERLFKY